MTNESKIWNYTEIPGIKVATLSQLGENKKELDIFYVILDNNVALSRILHVISTRTSALPYLRSIFVFRSVFANEPLPSILLRLRESYRAT